MLYKQNINFAQHGELGKQVYECLKSFCIGKKSDEDIFETLTPPVLNKHLTSLMKGLTAKVFRTFNASITLEKELPNEFKPFMQKEYNQVTINWYNPDGYIPAHCDCDSGMIKDYKIMVINICESGSTPRNFHIKARNGNCLYQNLDIPLENGTIITMCGNMQEDYAHEVKTGDSRRISITF
jgi:alkylated DNA repair dioxygenase AlkB